MRKIIYLNLEIEKFIKKGHGLKLGLETNFKNDVKRKHIFYLTQSHFILPNRENT